MWGYLIVAALLIVSMLIYFRIADKYNIIDRPNERSSHTQITLRGGGIVFWVAAMIYTVVNYNTEISWYYFAAISIIAIISFIDDIQSISSIVRIIIQFIAMSIVFYTLGVFGAYPIWAITIAYIMFIGILNAYNFMDGINGITGLYSLAVLSALQYVNLEVHSFVDPDFVWYPMLASVVFLFFNFRKRAKCFAGDVGSVTIAFWIVILLLQLMIKTHNLIWILFIAVYGVDTVCTILHRIYLKQNIFKAHRLHFYQILANECNVSHRIVSILYAVVQLFVCALVVFLPFNDCINTITILIPLLLLYLFKFKIMSINKK